MKSVQETVEILEANGIKIIYKPVALIEEHFIGYQSENQQSGSVLVEMDIYDVLSRLENRRKLKDPFST